MDLQKILLPFIPFLAFPCAQTQHDNGITELRELGWYIECPDGTLRVDGNIAVGLAPEKRGVSLRTINGLYEIALFNLNLQLKLTMSMFLIQNGTA
jgi:hypothetical protein